MTKRNAKAVYTASDVAEILGVSRQVVAKMLRDGVIVGTKGKKSWSVKHKDLAAYVQKKYGS